MWLRLSLAGGVQFEGIAPVLTEYRIGGGGLSAHILRQYETWQGVVARMARYAPEFTARHVDRARAYQLRYLARRAIQLGDAGMAMALLRAAIGSSIFPLLEEPVKSLTTLAAALVGRLIGPDRFARLAGRAMVG